MVVYLFAKYPFDLTEKINKMKSWIKTRENTIFYLRRSRRGLRGRGGRRGPALGRPRLHETFLVFFHDIFSKIWKIRLFDLSPADSLRSSNVKLPKTRLTKSAWFSPAWPAELGLKLFSSSAKKVDTKTKTKQKIPSNHKLFCRNFLFNTLIWRIFFSFFCFGVALLRSIFFCCQFTNPLEFVCFCDKNWVVKWGFDVKRDIVEKHWSICVYWDQFLTFLDFLRISDFAIMAEHDMGPETLTLSRGKFPILFSRLFVTIFHFKIFPSNQSDI